MEILALHSDGLKKRSQKHILSVYDTHDAVFGLLRLLAFHQSTTCPCLCNSPQIATDSTFEKPDLSDAPVDHDHHGHGARRE